MLQYNIYNHIMIINKTKKKKYKRRNKNDKDV